MTRKCTIAGCPSRSGCIQHRGVTFHVFPFDPKIRTIWLSNCHISSEKNITKNVLVCSRHFRRVDFLPVKSSNKYLLKQGAVPTIFPWGKIDAPNNTEQEVTDSSSNTNVVGSELNENESKEKVKSNQLSLKRPSDDKNENPSKMVKITYESSSLTSSSSSIHNEKLSLSNHKKGESNQSVFTLGAKIEAQDFNGVWHAAKVIEVDSDEKEVLIKFEKTRKNKGGSRAEEWLPMNSSRLRQSAKKPSLIFEMGEKCMARWSGPRRFPATITKIIGNDVYEVLFDDGYVKVVKGHHISKLKQKSSEEQSKTKSSNKSDWSLISINSLNLEELNLPDIPKDGEWCCHWVNDQPIGQEGFLMVGDHKKPTVIVEDWRLPQNWIKHMYQRSNVLGKWDVILVNPKGKRFRSKADLKQYLEELGQVYNPDIYDFSIHRRRAKDIGAYVYTKDYKPPPPPIPSSQQFPTEVGNATLPLSVTLSETLASISKENSTSTKAVDSKEIKETGEGEIVEDGYVYINSLKVQIIDNLFRCPQEGCNKNFRKENHLQIHVKHYHHDLAKLLGVCPNMQELAYKRTLGAASEEPLPKNHLPNVQFFAKLYQQDIASKVSRKSNTTTPTHSEFPSPSGIDTINADIINKSDNLETGVTFSLAEETITSDSSKNKSSNSTNILEDQTGHAVGDDTSIISLNQKQCSTPKVIKELMPTVKSYKKRKNKAKKLKVTKKVLSNKITSSLLDATVGVSDQEETRHSFNEIKQTQLSLKKFKPEPLSIVTEANLDGTSQTTGSIQENSQSPRYINENGEIIKIVRMRQEEIINCLCSYSEEDGLMIQCELCLCWQHGICNGIEKESQVPEKYICYICRNPQRGRSSLKYIHDQDWLYEGKLPVANYHATSPDLEERFEILRKSHILTGNLLELKRFMHSLKVKINIAENKDHPKLYLWAKSWEQPLSKEKQIIPMDESKNIEINDTEDKIQTKKEIKVETDIMDESMMDNKDAQKEDNKEKISQNDYIKTECISADVTNDLNKSQSNEKPETPTKVLTQPNIPQPEAPIDPVECQRRLWDHIEYQQSLVNQRLDYIEKQIIELESLDEDEIPSNPSDFSKEKELIAMYIRDLEIMKSISKINTIQSTSAGY